ncbi:MAG: hypothetical protein HY023_16530, partial [Chloroflexi bacterium]|nr:hypothetical protein [Chloroflexota bacterium]
MPEIILYVLLAVVLAIAIDFGLIRWLRRRWKADDTGPQVRLFGAYSPVLTWLRYRRLPAAISEARSWTWPEFGWGRYLVEWLIIMAVASLYGEDALLDFDARQLQQTGEHNESATLPLLADVSLRRYGEIPLWNPYMLTGFPHAGDFVNHFWNPVSTIPIWLWGGINGMKASVFISFALAGIGEWLFAHVFGGRGFIRLWAGILFMISGGLAMLWRVGWYELLLGMAWFPWCFASFWWAVRRRDRASLALAAICVAMVLTAGGGYYPFYLLVSLSALALVVLLSSHRADRWPKAQRAIAIAALGVGLAAVTLLPLADGYRYTVRDAGQDLDQRFSQPIRYALINYVVSQPAWFNTEILGSAGGWNWFYIGFLPVLAALSLTPLALSRRHRRPALIGVAVLALVILAWHASKFAPVKYIYDWVPFLYTFRFPNRLLVLATSPLIVLGGIGLQSLLLDLRRWGRGFVAVVSRKDGGPAITGVSIKHILDVALIVVLVLTLRDVYSINKVFAFAPRPRNPKPNTALTWLKNYDPDLYYTNIGGRTIYWDWTPAAYEMEMPIINFEYGRHVATSDQQHG